MTPRKEVATASSIEARVEPELAGRIEVRVHAPGNAAPEGMLLLHRKDTVRAHREEKLAERSFEVGAGQPSFELVLAFE